MNVLFFIEPLIQLDSPYVQAYWLNHHIKIMFESLKRLNYKCSFGLNSSLKEILEEVEYRDEIEQVFSFEQKELKVFSYSSIGIIEKWYNGTYSDEEMKTYKKIMSEKFEKAEFDIIVAFSPVPYLKELYPEALILHYEFGFFSRVPYPISFFLDPVGPGGYSYLKEFHSDILKNISLSEDDRKDFSDFLYKIKEIVKTGNPFKHQIDELRKKYEYIVLLPLQFNNFYLFDLEAGYRSQFEYLEDVLIKTSGLNIGILVTQHLAARNLTRDNISYFRKKYANFIYIEESENYISPSQIIVPYVDAVITVSTSVGYHALLWDKKLITLGKNYLKVFSDSDDLYNLVEVLKNPPRFRQRDELVYWIVMNYSIPEEYIKNEKWLKGFLENGVLNINNLSSFYRSIDEPKRHFSYLLEKSSRDLKDTFLGMNESLADKYVRIYTDTGKGYTELESHKIGLSEEIVLKIPEYHIKSIACRFYGVDVIRLNGVFVRNLEGGLTELTKEKSPAYYESENGNTYIDHFNCFIFNINSKVREIVFYIKDFGNTGMYEFLQEYRNLEEKLRVGQEEIMNNNRKIIELETEIMNKNNKILEKEEIEKLHNSIISYSLLTAEEIQKSKIVKLLHLWNRFMSQMIFGSLKEKKSFMKWIMRNPSELKDSRYNPVMKLSDILRKIKED